MKKTLLIILNVLIAHLLTIQTSLAQDSVTDPFCLMIKTIYSLDSISFHSQHNTKQVFENDTISTNAKVFVKKKGTAISFLHITPEKSSKELLFCHDSAWVVDHHDKIMNCYGTNTDQISHNSMSQFFPFTLFNIDTAILKVEPFWKILEQTEEQTVVSLDIASSSKDLTDIRVEFTIGNSDYLPYRIIQESVYLKADKLYQEQVFSEYSFHCSELENFPKYFSEYTKFPCQEQKTENMVERKEEENPGEISLKDLELYDLAGNPFVLPDKGLILFDLWYVGCPPCMKSAPVIEKLYTEYDEKVYFFSINETDQDTAKIIRFKEKMGVTFPVLLGGKENLAVKVTGRSGYPIFILFDARSGKVLWKFNGYSDNLEDIIKEAIEQNL